MMRSLLAAALAITAGLLASASAVASVPSTIGFSARLVDDKSGDAVTGSHRIAFELFDAESAGNSIWKEGREVSVDDGLLFTDVGATRPLDPTVFDGRKLYLQVSLDDVTMEPRIALDSVPYAIRAGAADSIGGIDAEDVQHRITTQCTPGNFIIGVNADGTAVCAPDLSGSGDVTAVFAGTGLQGGANSGDITLSLLQTCALNQILKWNGTAWACALDQGGTTSGDITSVTTAPGSGMQGGVATGDAALSLLTSCASGQLLKWNGTAWACANDIDTDTNTGGDISDVIAGAGLTGGAAAGAATLDVVGGYAIAVTANAVALDYPQTDIRYVNATGDTMTGPIDMGGNRLYGRSCPTGYILLPPALCVENIDVSGHTFTACANRCRVNGAHMCSSAETRAAMASGVTFGSPFTLDWIDDQIGDDNALYVNATDSNNPDGTSATSASNWCRCCTDVE